MESTDESRRLTYVMDYLIGGVDQSKAGNGGPGCYEFRSDYRKAVESVILVSLILGILYKTRSSKDIKTHGSHEGRISENAHNSKQFVLVLYCVMMGIQVGFKFATRTLIFYFQPCHVISTVQIFLLASRPNKYTSIIFRTHLGLLQGPLLALLFPVLDTYTLPFEIEMYFIQHIAILVVPVYLYTHGEPYSCNSLIKFWLCSYPVFVLYHILFLQPISMYTGVNVSTILCPVPTDPFYGPNYVLHAAWHQGLCIFLMLCTYACLLPVMDAFNKRSCNNNKEDVVVSDNNGNKKLL